MFLFQRTYIYCSQTFHWEFMVFGFNLHLEAMKSIPLKKYTRVSLSRSILVSYALLQTLLQESVKSSNSKKFNEPFNSGSKIGWLRIQSFWLWSFLFSELKRRPNKHSNFFTFMKLHMGWIVLCDVVYCEIKCLARWSILEMKYH